VTVSPYSESRNAGGLALEINGASSAEKLLPRSFSNGSRLSNTETSNEFSNERNRRR
jgi:hypothetical protein